ncbi:MAG: peptide deformylase, partial [Acutalibacteraceae bacterium]|nr:peptide deformylase [Acutalibacteraceae bacterium]
MAIRNIVKIGDDVLRKVCRSQLTFDEKLHTVLDDMAETMYKAEGVGLAAPQIGILRRYCVVDVGDGLIELINPVITEKSGSQTGSEGCLSIPDRFEEVVRPLKVTVRAQDRNGKNIVITAEGFKARAF